MGKSLIAERGVTKDVGVAIASELDDFVAGHPISIPAIPLANNANGSTELLLSFQKASTPAPFSPSSFVSLLGEVLLENPSVSMIALPTFTEEFGKTLLAISASVQRTSVAPQPSEASAAA